MKPAKTTTACANAGLPAKWYFRIGKAGEDQEVFCLLNDMDLLIAQENGVLGELLEGTCFSGELFKIRKKVLTETWGEDYGKLLTGD